MIPKMTVYDFVHILENDPGWEHEVIESNILFKSKDRDFIFIRNYKTNNKLMKFEYIDGGNKDASLFKFDTIYQLIEFCVDHGIHEFKPDEKDMIILNIDGLGEEMFETEQQAIDYINGRVSLYVFGNKKELKVQE